MSACVVWSPPDTTPASLLGSRPPESVWIQLADRPDPIVVANPELRSDTVFGVYPGSSTPGHPLERAVIPVQEIRHIAVHHVDVERTAAAALIPAALAIGSVLLVAP
ncbi:MAG TPA: hypothetical protein VFS28_03600 [Gemmatimonadales bacterium]|nr:hypothetical protein [Gemmatimonadales bacterium]